MEDDLFVTVKEEFEIYTKEEWINQYGLDPMCFANNDIHMGE